MQIESDNALALAYSYYDDALNEPRISAPRRVWVGGKPNLPMVYKMGRERGLDGVVMVWGRTGAGGTPAPNDLYLIDIDRRQVYRKKGTTTLTRMAKTVVADFIKGRAE